MKMSKSLFCSLVGCLIFAVLVHSQDQSGFISIACGIPANHYFTEKTTKINYISDEKFINSGVSNSITSDLQKDNPQQCWNLRSFPQGTRNCYRVNITSGSKYLIRATFLYGNYDGQNYLPTFDLHFGPNLWETVKITNASIFVELDIIHVPSQDYIQVCLVDTGTGTPFISALEISNLRSEIYVTQSGSLSLFMRLNIGSTSDEFYRYSYDVYDRAWTSVVNKQPWTYIRNASITDDYLVQNDYNPAAIVMSTAATPVNESAPFILSLQPDNASDQFYVYMHFLELQVLQKNQTRSFDITINDILYYENAVPDFGFISTLAGNIPFSGEKLLIILQKTNSSTLPPILNAIEVYKLNVFSQSETEREDVDAILSIKSSYGVTRNWQGDPCGPKAYIWEGLNCIYNDQKPPRIKALNLSSSELTGQIDPSITKLIMLENFVGQNPYLCESPPCNKKKKNSILIPIAATFGGVLILVIVAATLFFTLKRRKQRGTGPIEISQGVEKVKEQKDMSLQVINRQYSYSEVLKMTNNFSTILGKGGFGTVYLGDIEETPVAVKMLSSASAQGYKQFHAEIKLLMKVHHRNLTSLIGFCNEETNKVLIYEYMENGNLQDCLSGKGVKSKFLTWEERLCIALDAALGLEYLHNGCTPPIFHRDVKSSNILLNENFRAKIADFGLSKAIPTNDGTHVTTAVAGTHGYIDPEYQITNKLTEKSDVFSFGVVLFEIITGLPVISRNHERTHIKDWISSLVGEGNIKAIVDTRLGGDFDSSSAWKVVDMAMTCVSRNPSSRPTIGEVVNELKECLAIEVARHKHSGADMTNTEHSSLAR